MKQDQSSGELLPCPKLARAALPGIIEDLTKAECGAGNENPHVRNAIDAVRRLAEVVSDLYAAQPPAAPVETKSAPVFKAPQQAESEPSVTPACAGADTRSYQSQAKEPEASGGLCTDAPHAVRVGEPARTGRLSWPAQGRTSNVSELGVTAGETAPHFQSSAGNAAQIAAEFYKTVPEKHEILRANVKAIGEEISVAIAVIEPQTAPQIDIEQIVRIAKEAIWKTPKFEGKYGMCQPTKGMIADAVETALRSLALTRPKRSFEAVEAGGCAPPIYATTTEPDQVSAREQLSTAEYLKLCEKYGWRPAL